MFSSRITMTQFVDKHSHYPAERDYVRIKGSFVATVPRLKRSLQVVAKVGEAHQGQNKYLLYPGQVLHVRDSVIFEEFVPDAISIRVLIIGDKTYVLEYQDDPENPRPLGKEWIKNINPIIKLVKNREADQSFIHDTLALSQILGYDYLGVDYVVSKDRSICLEVNPFPGISLEEIRREAQKYWLQKVESLRDVS